MDTLTPNRTFTGFILDKRHPGFMTTATQKEPYLRFRLLDELPPIDKKQAFYGSETITVEVVTLRHAKLNGIYVWIDSDAALEFSDSAS
jgi:hypothetical protein